MEPSLHSVLLVEDDEAIAEEVGEILRSLACHYHLFDNREDAIAAARSVSYCLAIVDLQIKAGPKTLRPHVEHGKALIRDLRSVHPKFLEAARTYQFPILVVSGFAKEGPEAVEVMKDGANDILQKPFRTNQLSRGIRSLLDRTGRTRHADCLYLQPTAGSSDSLLLSIPGGREGRRTIVCIGGQRAGLTDASLRILLELVVGMLKGRPVHKNDMGGSDARGFKGVSRLDEQLRPATGTATITRNEYGGLYMLAGDIELGDFDYDGLEQLGDARIARLAGCIRSLRAESKEDGNS